jgi:hypothetical protein
MRTFHSSNEKSNIYSQTHLEPIEVPVVQILGNQLSVLLPANRSIRAIVGNALLGAYDDLWGNNCITLALAEICLAEIDFPRKVTTFGRDWGD